MSIQQKLYLRFAWMLFFATWLLCLVSLFTNNAYFLREGTFFITYSRSIESLNDLVTAIFDPFWEQYTPRNTRPLSNLIIILNEKLRVFLWNFLPFHPSASILWVLNLVVLPCVSYRLLKKLGYDSFLSILGVSLLLVSAPVLNGNWVHFRHAKPIFFVGLVCCLYLAKHYEEIRQISSKSKKTLFILGIFLLINFLVYVDELSVCILPLIFLLAPRFFKSVYVVILSLMTYGLLVFNWYYLFPFLAKKLHGDTHAVSNYDVLHRSLSLEAIGNLKDWLFQAKLNLLGSLGVYHHMSELSGFALSFEAFKVILYISILLWAVWLILKKKDIQLLKRVLLFFLFYIAVQASHILTTRGLFPSWINYHYGPQVALGVIFLLVAVSSAIKNKIALLILFGLTIVSTFKYNQNLNNIFYEISLGTEGYFRGSNDALITGKNIKKYADMDIGRDKPYNLANIKFLEKPERKRAIFRYPQRYSLGEFPLPVVSLGTEGLMLSSSEQILLELQGVADFTVIYKITTRRALTDQIITNLGDCHVNHFALILESDGGVSLTVGDVGRGNIYLHLEHPISSSFVAFGIRKGNAFLTADGRYHEMDLKGHIPIFNPEEKDSTYCYDPYVGQIESIFLYKKSFAPQELLSHLRYLQKDL